MKKVYDLYLDYNLISNRKNVKNSLVIGKIESLSQFISGNVKLVINESDYSLLGEKILTALKNSASKVILNLVDDGDCLSLEKAISNGGDKVLVVGDNDLLDKVRCFSSKCNAFCYALPTTPYLEEVNKPSVYLKKDDFSMEFSVKPFEKVLVVEDVILKADNSFFAKSYISVMSKLTALIDYKINCFLSGAKVDDEVFSIAKRAINLLASITNYQNYKSAILGGQMILSSIGDASPFDGTGVDVIYKALKVFANGVSDGKSLLTAFEKTAKIYHMYFSNDFSSLLSLPDYQSDLELLETASGLKRNFFYKNLKIPSEKRRKLISILLAKIRDDFKKETSLILSVLPTVIKIYNQLDGTAKEYISYKQIKNSVTLGTYLTEKTSVLTLCRDEGILKCAN